MNQKSEKYEARIQFLQEELDKVMLELKEAEDDRSNLQRAVDERGIGMAHIDRMTSERERLRRVSSRHLKDSKKPRESHRKGRRSQPQARGTGTYGRQIAIAWVSDWPHSNYRR